MPTNASGYAGICETVTVSRTSDLVVGKRCRRDNVGWMWGASKMLVSMSVGG